jgi:hypothetical protein
MTIFPTTGFLIMDQHIPLITARLSCTAKPLITLIFYIRVGPSRYFTALFLRLFRLTTLQTLILSVFIPSPLDFILFSLLALCMVPFLALLTFNPFKAIHISLLVPVLVYLIAKVTKLVVFIHFNTPIAKKLVFTTW